jgi:catechol 2,3-dioxygenase-like lactoylglutathione lyase family enzyme
MGDLGRRFSAALAVLAASQVGGPSAWAQQAPALQISGVGVNVSDIERSRKFYVEIIGLREALRVPSEGPIHELVLSASGRLGGEAIVVLAKLEGQPLKPGRESFGRIITNPVDTDAVVRRAKAAGYMVSEYPRRPNGPVVAFVEDPDGYRVELYQRAAAP